MLIAHRGGIPENTILAFEKCLKHNRVNIIEFDVWMTKDNEFVVVHNSDLYFKNGTFKPVTSMTLRELQISFPSVPTLLDVLLKIDESESSIKLNLDVKQFGIFEKLAYWLKAFLSGCKSLKATNIYITSFLHTEILKFKNIYSDVHFGLIFGRWPLGMNVILTSYDFIGRICNK